MRIFSTAVEAVKEVERDLWEMGHIVTTQSYQDKKGEIKSREIVGYSFQLLDGKDWMDTFMTLGLRDVKECQEYVLAEIRERLFPNPLTCNPGSSWIRRKEVWEKFLHHEGIFSYTYGERIGTQLTNISSLHSDDSQSRQLVMTIYDQDLDSMNRGGIARVPCTMYYQFLERGDDLYLIHNMRSCDLYTHFPIDLSISWLMAAYQAGVWKKQPKLLMQIGSLHAFEKNMIPRGVF